MEDIRGETESALRLTAETMKKYYDRHRQPSPDFKVGDKVYLEGLNLTVQRPMTKLSEKRYGPFPIIKKIGKSAFKLRLPRKWSRVHPVFNEYLLTTYNPPVYASQKQQIPHPNDVPEIEEELSHEKYDVEEILDAQVDKPTGKLQYLVKWKDHDDPKDNTWEWPQTLTQAAAKVRKYYKDNPGAPRPVPEMAKKLRLRPLVYDTEFPLPTPKKTW